MPVFFTPYTISQQLETVQLLQKIRFISQDYKKFLHDLEYALKLRVPLNQTEKQTLQEILTKYGYLIHLSK